MKIYEIAEEKILDEIYSTRDDMETMRDDEGYVYDKKEEEYTRCKVWIDALNWVMKHADVSYK